MVVDDGSVYLGQKQLEKSFSTASNRNREKMALSDWELLDALLSMMSSSESFDLLPALEVSKFCFNYR